jgi:phosphoglycolate phosphatase-like HAD superfamily hydrolase
MFQNVIFDWSGVVNDDVYAVYQTAMEIFKANQVDSIPFDEFRSQWKQPYMTFYNQYIPNITKEEQDNLYRQNIVKFDQNRPYLDIYNLIKKFYQHQINLFVVSSNFKETMDQQIKSYDLEKVFKEVVLKSYDKSGDVKFLIKKYNLSLDNTVFIGDSNQEIEAGKTNGIKTCAVTWGIALEENLKPFHPDFIVHNLQELEEVILKPVIIN